MFEQFIIQANPTITNIIPNKDAFPEPYLSDSPPKMGDPIPIIKTCNAAANPKISLPVLR